MSMMNGVRSEGQTDIIKSNLEEWREVVIKADAVLGWEEDWYPAITGGVLSAAFFFLVLGPNTSHVFCLYGSDCDSD